MTSAFATDHCDCSKRDWFVKLVDCNVFADIKKACEMGLNNHRTIIYEPEKEKEGEEEGEGGEDGDY